MSNEMTFAIIKPDAVAKKHTGEILHRMEKKGLKIVGLKRVLISKQEAEQFYAVHKERPFYDALTSFLSSGPIVVAVLEGDDAISRYRKLMGATNPKEAEPGTLRADFAESIDHNAVHGSDAPETAKIEIAFFFKDSEIQN